MGAICLGHTLAWLVGHFNVLSYAMFWEFGVELRIATFQDIDFWEEELRVDFLVELAVQASQYGVEERPTLLAELTVEDDYGVLAHYFFYVFFGAEEARLQLLSGADVDGARDMPTFILIGVSAVDDHDFGNGCALGFLYFLLSQQYVHGFGCY